jgi:hypothetical protein
LDRRNEKWFLDLQGPFGIWSEGCHLLTIIGDATSVTDSQVILSLVRAPALALAIWNANGRGRDVLYISARGLTDTNKTPTAALAEADVDGVRINPPQIQHRQQATDKALRSDCLLDVTMTRLSPMKMWGGSVVRNPARVAEPV